MAGQQRGEGRKGEEGQVPRLKPVSPEWEARETEFDKLGGELSVSCLCVFQVEAGGGAGREREAAWLVELTSATVGQHSDTR